MRSNEESAVVDLVLNVFDEFVAPQYSNEGITEFKKIACEDALVERIKGDNFVVVAESNRKIIGAIEMRGNSHIALLFVEKSHQHKGIAKELLQRSIEICKKRNPGIQKITVNSSPNAFAVYQKIGFKGLGNEKVSNGIRFVPMELDLNRKRSSQPVISPDR